MTENKTIEDIAFEIYNNTVFKRFFEKNDPKVLTWANNVLEKVASPNILPTFIKKGGEDFNAYWGSVCHLFALIVLYSRQYTEIDTNKILFDLFVESRGLITTEVDTQTQMEFLFNNYVEEYRKRGRMDIVNKEGVILGELLRLIGYMNPEEFIFSLLMSRDPGWTVGYSSPTWNRCDSVLNVTKGYETTESINDLSKYPLVNPTGVVLVKDTTNEGDPIQAITFVGNQISGISSSIDMDKLLLVSPNIPYMIQFRVKTDKLANLNLHFGIQAFDENKQPVMCEESFAPTIVNGVRIPAKTNNFVKPTTGSNDWNFQITSPNVYYQYVGLISKLDRSFAAPVDLNFKNGRGIKFQENVKYISLDLTQNRALVRESSANVFIYDIKIKPIYLPFYQGHLGEKNVIASFYTNNSLSSQKTVKSFIDNYLISYKNIFAADEINSLKRSEVTIKVFSDRRTYIEDAEITIGTLSLVSDRNGEAVTSLFPGDYLLTVKKRNFVSVIDRLVTIEELESQVIYVPMLGDLYDRKVTFVVKASGITMPGCTIIFNGKQQTTDSAGATTFYVVPGLYPYTVTKDGYYPITDRSVNVSDDMIENVTLVLIPLYDITFSVKTGSPATALSGVLVEFNPDTKVLAVQPPSIANGANQQTTDSSGRAVFPKVLGGGYSWNATKYDYISVNGVLNVTRNETVNVLMNEVPNFNISFAVFDYNPTTGAKVALQGATVSYAGDTQYTPASGIVTFAKVKGNEYTYEISKDGFVSQSGKLRPVQDQTITIDLSRNEYTATIEVKGANNAVVEGATVVVAGKTLTTDRLGRVSLKLVNGSYSAVVTYSEYEPKTADFTISNADKLTTISLTQVLYTVTITVRETIDSTLVSTGATVQFGTLTQQTNSLGQATFKVPKSPTPYTIRVSKTYFEAVTDSMVVDRTDSRSYTLTRLEGIVTFTVSVEGSTRLPGANISVSGYPIIQTNSQGVAILKVKYNSYNYSVEKLPDFIGQSGNFSIFTPTQTVNVNLSNKLYTVTLEVGRMMSGSFKGIRNATVRFNGQTYYTGSFGALTISNVKSGTYSCSINASGYESYSQNVYVSQADVSERIVLTYQTNTSTIRVTKDGSALSGQLVSYDVDDGSDDGRYSMGSLRTNSYGEVQLVTPVGGEFYYTVDNDECVITTGSGSNGSTATVQLLTALAVQFGGTPPSVSHNGIQQVAGTTLLIAARSSGSILTVTFRDKTTLTRVIRWPKSFSITGTSMFRGCTNLNSLPNEAIPLTTTTQLDSFFHTTTNLKSIPTIIFSRATSTTSATYCFSNSGLTSVSGEIFPLSVIYHEYAFSSCKSLVSATGRIFGKGGGDHDFDRVFHDCTSLSTIGYGGSTSNVSVFERSVNMRFAEYAFYGCKSFKGGFDVLFFNKAHSALRYVHSIFENCSSLELATTTLALTNVTDVSSAFSNCTSLAICPLLPTTTINWNYVFSNCKSITDLSNLSSGSASGSSFTNLETAMGAFGGSGVRKIPARFFKNCQKLKNVSFCFANTRSLQKFEYYSNSEIRMTKVPTIMFRTGLFEGTAWEASLYPTMDCSSMFFNSSISDNDPNYYPYGSPPYGIAVALFTWPPSTNAMKVNANMMFYNAENIGGGLCGYVDSNSAAILGKSEIMNGTPFGSGDYTWAEWDKRPFTHTQMFRGTPYANDSNLASDWK